MRPVLAPIPCSGSSGDGAIGVISSHPICFLSRQSIAARTGDCSAIFLNIRAVDRCSSVNRSPLRTGTVRRGCSPIYFAMLPIIRRERLNNGRKSCIIAFFAIGRKKLPRLSGRARQVMSSIDPNNDLRGKRSFRPLTPCLDRRGRSTE